MNPEEITEIDVKREVPKEDTGFRQWSVFVWKLIRSLALMLAGGAVIYFVCRWLIY